MDETKTKRKVPDQTRYDAAQMAWQPAHKRAAAAVEEKRDDGGVLRLSPGRQRRWHVLDTEVNVWPVRNQDDDEDDERVCVC